MCIAVVSVKPEKPIRLDFTLERIYLRRDGGANVDVDLLVRNLGDSAIDSLRVILRDPLVDIHRLEQKRISRTKASRLVERLRQRELAMLRLSTDHLLHDHHSSNWPYRKLHHVRIDHNATREGVFAIQRFGQRKDEPGALEGFIKHGWQVQAAGPPVDEWTWLVCAANGVAVFDLKCIADAKEHLQRAEAMWLRLHFPLPARGSNRKTIAERIFARLLSYDHLFLSPSQVCKHVRNQLNCFDSTKWGEKLRTLLDSAKRGALNLIPEHADKTEVKDCRVMIYREYGMGQKRVDHRGNPDPVRPPVDPTLDLPPEADPPGRRRWALPIFLHPIFASHERNTTVEQFWLGADHQESAQPDNCVTSVSTEQGNIFYLYLPWISLILSLIGIGIAIFRR
jgi:hypothetical protein